VEGCSETAGGAIICRRGLPVFLLPLFVVASIVCPFHSGFPILFSSSMVFARDLAAEQRCDASAAS